MHFGWLPGRGRMKYTHKKKVVQNKRVEFSHWLIERDESLASLFFRFLHPSGGVPSCACHESESCVITKHTHTHTQSKKKMSIFFLVCVVLSVDIPLCPSASKEKKKENFPPREGEENDLGGRALGSFVAHEQENEAPRKRQPNLFLFFFVFLKRPWPPSKNRPSLFFFKRSRKERKKKKKQMGMKGTRVFCRFKWKKRSFRRCALRITHHQPGGLVSRGYCVRDTHTHNEKNKSVVRHERKENGRIYFLKIKKKKKRPNHHLQYIV